MAWDPSPDPSAAGYNVYYGTAPRAYTNTVSVGNTNSATVYNLVNGTTYYFAATTYNLAGLESDFSEEISYTPQAVPQNVRPTLDPIDGLVINEDAGEQTIELSGITSGSPNETQTLTVSAFSSNPSLISNPTVSYTSPNRNGSITFAPMSGSFGSATMTVMVDDGGSVSNTLIRSFQVTVNPVNDPPTLDPIDDLVIKQNSGQQTVPLSGITPGNPNETQTLVVTATSSSPSLIAHPVVNYTSPNPGGTLTFRAPTNGFGTAVITVTVNDGQPINASTTQTFSVTVNPVLDAASILTNAVIVPNQAFRVALSPPYSTGDRLTYSLTAAPSGAMLVTRRGVPTFAWTPTSEQASTTNLVVVRVTNTTTPALSTNQGLHITVLDYLEIVPLASAVQAGQTASLPISLSCSDGVTNFSFRIAWPTARFTAPTLTISPSVKLSGTAQLSGTDVQVRLSAQPDRIITGSNVVAQLTFQAVSNQPSAFVKLAVSSVSGSKPTGANYVVCASKPAQVVVVNDLPLLEWTGGATSALNAYGRVGVNYELQASTNLLSPLAWNSAGNYLQTNIVQTFSIDRTKPYLMYRIKQR